MSAGDRRPIESELRTTGMAQSRILGHDRYRLILREAPGGGSQAGRLRITPGVSPAFDGGLFLEDRTTHETTWFTAHAAPGASGPWRPGGVEQSAELFGLTMTVTRWVAPDETSELQVVRWEAKEGPTRRLRLTALRDVAFDDGDGFDSHPVFSKLFLQTACRQDPPALYVRRRPRSAMEQHPTLVFAPIVIGPGVGLAREGAWYETDRVALLGRILPYDPDLHEHVPHLAGGIGDVLDPTLALRVDVTIEPRGRAEVAFLLSVAPTLEEAEARVVAWSRRGRLHEERVAAERAERQRHLRLGLSETQTANLETLGVALLRGETLRPPAPLPPRGEPGAGAVADDVAAASPTIDGSPADATSTEVLAALGVTAGRPFVLAWIDRMEARDRDLLLRGLQLWSELDLGLHAVLLYDEARPDLPDSVSVALRPASSVPPAHVTRLIELASASYVGATMTERAAGTQGADPANVSLGSATLHPNGRGEAPAPAQAPAPRTATATGIARDGGPTTGLEFDNGTGGFAHDGREYVIRIPAGPSGLQLPPRPWVNVLANPGFGCLLSETGAGPTWYGNSREHRLTPWRNDPVRDPHDEAIYLLDDESGDLASAWPGPVPSDVDYEVRHGFGSSVCLHRALGLEVETLAFVAVSEPWKATRVRLRNPGMRPRRIAVTSLTRLVLGPSTGGRERFVRAWAEPEVQALFARNPETPEFGAAHAFALSRATGSIAAVSHTCHAGSILGRAGDLAAPIGLLPGTPLDGHEGAGRESCFAHRLVVLLPPGGTAELCFVLGAGPDGESARALARSFADPARVDDEVARVEASWRERLEGLQIETPTRALDILVNGWLPYQTLACRIWGRSAFYQSGGAFGFRDQLQDASSLVPLDPTLTRDQILLHGSHQFVEGDVLHWWHPPGDVGLRTRFVDDLLWLPLLTATYIAQTGDAAILEEELPYVEAPLLEEGEAEHFLAARRSTRSADLYAHCCLALDRSLHQGPHGLPLFGAGDWNDGMNRVGIGGRGESVWMGFFLVCVLDSFLPHVAARGEEERATRYLAHRAALVRALETAGWDGAWYRRGYYDDGTPLGSAESTECRIDALVQAWAVLSGVAPAERAAQALAAAERELVSEEEGLIRLLTPAFRDTPQDPGYIKGYVAGVRENGGQYTHAALWLIRAFAVAGRRDRVAALLDVINPIRLSSDPERVARYQLEPYVVAADVYGVDPHVGRGGWSWYTGSSGWMSRVAVESLLGFRLVEGREVRIAPVIPDAWPGFVLRYRPAGGTTRYEIRVVNPEGCAEVVVAVEAPTLRAEVRGRAAAFTLADDGGAHVVTVRLGKAAS